MGNVEGRSSRAYTIPGGPEVLVDGTPSAGGLRGQLELTELGPLGPPRLNYRQFNWDPADEPAASRVNVVGHWGGHGRIHDDAGGAFPGLALTFSGLAIQDIPLLDPAAVGATGIVVTAVVIEQVSIVGLTSGPTISLGITGAAFADVIPATLLALSASSKRSLVLRPNDWSGGAGAPSLFVPSGSTLTLRVGVVGVGTAITLRPHVVGLIVR